MLWLGNCNHLVPPDYSFDNKFMSLLDSNLQFFADFYKQWLSSPSSNFRVQFAHFELNFGSLILCPLWAEIWDVTNKNIKSELETKYVWDVKYKNFSGWNFKKSSKDSALPVELSSKKNPTKGKINLQGIYVLLLMSTPSEKNWKMSILWMHGQWKIDQNNINHPTPQNVY